MSKTEINFENHFTEKYKLYSEMLYKIAFLYTHSKTDAEDILQDVFTKYFLTRKTFTSIEHEKAWFIRATQNKAIDYTRKSSRSYCELNENSENGKADISVENQQDVLKAITKLQNKYKTVVLLYYYYDYSVDEIAKTLKISSNAVKKRLQRARNELKVEMEDYINE